MPDASRVPKSISAFDGYIIRTASYLFAGTPANGERLGLTIANGNEWAARMTAWKLLYAAYINPLVSTSVVKQNVRTFIRDFKIFTRPLLNIIAASPAVIEKDATMFNLVADKNRKKPSKHVIAITDEVVAEAKPIGGGKLQIYCRTPGGSKRAHKHPHSDSVQVAIKIGGDKPPTDVKDGTYKELFTQAKFLLELGPENAGKKVYLYFRWYHTKHPLLSGHWGQLISLSLA